MTFGHQNGISQEAKDIAAKLEGFVIAGVPNDGAERLWAIQRAMDMVKASALNDVKTLIDVIWANEAQLNIHSPD